MKLHTKIEQQFILIPTIGITFFSGSKHKFAIVISWLCFGVAVGIGKK